MTGSDFDGRGLGAQPESGSGKVGQGRLEGRGWKPLQGVGWGSGGGGGWTEVGESLIKTRLM